MKFRKLAKLKHKPDMQHLSYQINKTLVYLA